MAFMPPQQAVPRPPLATPGIAGGGTVLQQGDPFGVNSANQAYQDALTKLNSTPTPTPQQTQYTPPNKTGDIIAGALALLFPQAPIAKAAAGYMQGAQEGSEQKYERANQEDYKKYQVAEQTRADEEAQANNLGRVADARSATEQRAEAEQDRHEIALQNEQYKREQIDERKRMDNSTIAYHANQIAQRAFSNQTGRMQYLRQVRHDADTLALGMTKDAISEQMAQERMGLTARIAALREVSVDSRFAQDVELRTSIKRLDAQNIAASGQIKAIVSNPSLTPQQQSAAIQAIQTKMDDAYQKTLTPIASRHPDVSKRMAEVESEIEAGTEAGDANDAGMSLGVDPYSAPGYGSGGGAPSFQQEYERTRQSLGGEAPGEPTSQSGARPSWTPPPADVASIGANAWLQANGDPKYAPLAGVIAANESSGNPRSVNPAGTGVGLFQINPQAHPDLARKYNLMDPVQNAKAAVELFNAQGAQPWFASMQEGGYGGWGGWAAANGYLGENGIMAPAQTPQMSGAQPKLGLAPQPGQPTRTTGQPPQAGGGATGGAKTALMPAQEFQATLADTIAHIKQNPASLNAQEQGIHAARQAGKITPQQESMALTQMQAALRQGHAAAQPGDPAAALRAAAQQDAAAPNAPAQPPPTQAPAAPTPEEQRAARMRAAVAAEPAHGVDLTPQVAGPNAAPLGTRRPAPTSGQPLISPVVQRAIQAYFALTTPEAKAQFLARQAPLLKKALQDMLAQGTQNTLTPPAM